eukprot:m.135581 g.135581  ORF g.135581 m.135581 type:complete len:183 (-) comp15851_c0_seq1:309-857(-)
MRLTPRALHQAGYGRLRVCNLSTPSPLPAEGLLMDPRHDLLRVQILIAHVPRPLPPAPLQCHEINAIGRQQKARDVPVASVPKCDCLSLTCWLTDLANALNRPVSSQLCCLPRARTVVAPQLHLPTHRFSRRGNQNYRRIPHPSFPQFTDMHHLTDRDSCVSVVEAMVGGISSLTLSTCLLH